MTRNNVKFDYGGISVYQDVIRCTENFNNALTIIKIPTTGDTPETTLIVNLNKIEERYTFRGYLSNGKNSSETYTSAISKKYALKTMFGKGVVINVTWEGRTFTFAVDKYEIGYKSKDERELDSGTTTSTTANKLVQSGQNFTTTVQVGAAVHNTTDNTFALVTVVDDDTTLTLDTDIMVSGESYSIYGNVEGELIYDVVISGSAGEDVI